MDLICLNCGEVWELDYVLHDEPKRFKRNGGAIYKCPSCPKTGAPKLDRRTSEMLIAAREVAELLGDDVDGCAAMFEDFGLI